MSPEPCQQLTATHEDYLELLRKLRALPGVKRVFVRSGIRFDYALLDREHGREFIRELAAHHVSGQLRVAPEHISDEVLRVMGKPPRHVYDEFVRVFEHASREAGKEQYLVPYLMSSHPGSTLSAAVELAEYCRDTKLPMAIARHMAEWRSPFRQDRDQVAMVFANAYREENEKRSRGRQKLKRSLRNVPAETLLTRKIDVFLHENYELRRNVMRGVAEFRERTGLGFDFRDLTAEARNSMTLQALKQGIRCWDKDIRRFVESDDIERYDPIGEFLERLPRWDGKDRVTELARRVQTNYDEWPRLFHIWMLSMVAMWQGKGQLTGNALVPLLIGRQGCGKTSFCRILLPREQREYYNDRVNFKNESDLNLGLTSFALINLDEFDKITQRQQIILKYLVSTADLKYRPPYGKAYKQHRRYASFIGTTNEQMPLTDPSGSRRFVCVEVAANIDFHTPVDYRQLYAQLKQELQDGERYWLTKEEEQALMSHNLKYQQIDGLGEKLLSLYRRPEPGESGRWISLKAISARLKEVYKGAYSEEPGTLNKIGAYLCRPEYQFERKRSAMGMEYKVVEIN